MENQLYVRIRGRILGPYDQEKLQSLARRGQLSRLHEVSQDAANWVRASTYPELFLTENASIAAAAQPAAGDGRDAARAEGPSAALGRLWWYRKNGQESGPIDQTALQQMVASGNIGPDDLVWSDGMRQWTPARQAPGISPARDSSWGQPTGAGPSAGSAGRGDDLPLYLCKAIMSSRPWVIFIAVVAFVYAGLVIVFGILALIFGANHHNPAVVAGGLIDLIVGIDASLGGLLLSQYGNRIASLRYSPQAAVLEKAMDALRTFWIYVAINLIILLAFVVFGIIWLVAISGSLPW